MERHRHADGSAIGLNPQLDNMDAGREAMLLLTAEAAVARTIAISQRHWSAVGYGKGLAIYSVLLSWDTSLVARPSKSATAGRTWWQPGTAATVPTRSAVPSQSKSGRKDPKKPSGEKSRTSSARSVSIASARPVTRPANVRV